MEKLHLEDALGDSPQTRNLLGVFESDSSILKSYVIGLHRCCNRVLTAQKELCASMQFLSAHLKSYNQQEFPLESEDSVLSSVLHQFASIVDEMSSVQQVLISQLGNNTMHPINKFLTADLEEVSSMKEMFRVFSSDHERALAAYVKYPKKRENDKGRQEVVDDLYVSRKKFHQTAMHYFALLNALQYKRKSSLLEPLIGILAAQKTFFEMGQEITNKTEFDEFIANISASVLEVHREQMEDSQRRVEEIETIEQQSIHKYFAELPADMPQIIANTTLSQKAGYLFLRSKQSLLTTRWDRLFFFIQGGNLISQSKDEVAGCSLMDLNIETRVEPSEADDRRFVFHVFQPSTKKSLLLQAENGRERDEWIATIRNVVMEGQRLENTETPVTPRSPSEMNSVQNFFSSVPVAIPKAVEVLRETSGGTSRSNIPATPSSTPAESSGFCPDLPIQFDLTSPDETNQSTGTAQRVNPFNEIPGALNDSSSDQPQSFVVRFLGSQQVMTDRGEGLVRETIRQVMAARAIHNVFKMCEVQLVVNRDSLKLIDESSKIRLQISLEHISFWAVHHENKRLFGFITRTPGTSDEDPSTFACFVFECNSSGEELCRTLAVATQLAFQAFMQKKAKELELSKDKQDSQLSDVQEKNQDESDNTPKVGVGEQFPAVEDRPSVPDNPRQSDGIETHEHA